MKNLLQQIVLLIAFSLSSHSYGSPLDNVQGCYSFNSPNLVDDHVQWMFEGELILYQASCAGAISEYVFRFANITDNTTYKCSVGGSSVRLAPSSTDQVTFRVNTQRNISCRTTDIKPRVIKQKPDAYKLRMRMKNGEYQYQLETRAVYVCEFMDTKRKLIKEISSYDSISSGSDKTSWFTVREAASYFVCY